MPAASLIRRDAAMVYCLQNLLRRMLLIHMRSSAMMEEVVLMLNWQD